jgi:hypothetical protein
VPRAKDRRRRRGRMGAGQTRAPLRSAAGHDGVRLPRSRTATFPRSRISSPPCGAAGRRRAQSRRHQRAAPAIRTSRARSREVIVSGISYSQSRGHGTACLRAGVSMPRPAATWTGSRGKTERLRSPTTTCRSTTSRACVAGRCTVAYEDDQRKGSGDRGDLRRAAPLQWYVANVSLGSYRSPRGRKRSACSPSATGSSIPAHPRRRRPGSQSRAEIAMQIAGRHVGRSESAPTNEARRSAVPCSRGRSTARSCSASRTPRTRCAARSCRSATSRACWSRSPCACPRCARASTPAIACSRRGARFLDRVASRYGLPSPPRLRYSKDAGPLIALVVAYRS